MPVYQPGGAAILAGGTTAVTASRAFSTEYTNSNDVPMALWVKATAVAAGGSLKLLSGSSAGAPATTTIEETNNDSGAASNRYIIGLVPPGYKYQAQVLGGGAPGLGFWFETI